MVQLKVVKVGDELGVAHPEEVIDRLRTEHGGSLFLVEAGDGSYRLTATDPSSDEIVAKAEGIMNRYPKTLDVLAQ